jgi:hypothetical protein
MNHRDAEGAEEERGEGRRVVGCRGWLPRVENPRLEALSGRPSSGR